MTASGVLSSWLASEMKRRCWSQARSTGVSAHLERMRTTTARAAMAPTKIATSMPSCRAMAPSRDVVSQSASVNPESVCRFIHATWSFSLWPESEGLWIAFAMTSAIWSLETSMAAPDLLRTTPTSLTSSVTTKARSAFSPPPRVGGWAKPLSRLFSSMERVISLWVFAAETKVEPRAATRTSPTSSSVMAQNLRRSLLSMAFSQGLGDVVPV